MELIKKTIKFISNSNFSEIIIKIFEKLKILNFVLTPLNLINKSKNFHNGKFNSIKINTTNYISELCELGGKYNTDKSQFNKIGHRHSYTAIYNILFSQFRDKEFNFAEIGILDNASIKMWRDYFKYAHIDGFDYDNDLILKAEKHKLNNVNYHFVDVNNTKSINDAFRKTSKTYDIIIDDSTHFFDHQVNIINTTKDYLNKGGFLVIEDIYTKKKSYKEDRYYEKLENVKAEFSDIAHTRGILSAARSADPNSANSQFFICFDSAPHLDRQYSAFGKVIKGMEFVDMIKKGDPNSGAVPNPDKIISIKSK